RDGGGGVGLARLGGDVPDLGRYGVGAHVHSVGAGLIAPGIVGEAQVGVPAAEDGRLHRLEPVVSIRGPARDSEVVVCIGDLAHIQSQVDGPSVAILDYRAAYGASDLGGARA